MRSLRAASRLSDLSFSPFLPIHALPTCPHTPVAGPSRQSQRSYSTRTARRDDRPPDVPSIGVVENWVPDRPRHVPNGAFKPIQPSTALTPRHFQAKPPPTPMALVSLLLSRLEEWKRSERLATKLSAYGVGGGEQWGPLLEWTEGVKRTLSTVKNDLAALTALGSLHLDAQLMIDAFTGPSTSASWASVMESQLLRQLVIYISKLPSFPAPKRKHLEALLRATDLARLPFDADHVYTRMFKRHFHLHVGPTNSGKTYNALKRLASVESGAYAGPLRLLAHEVWERLNLGTVGGLDGNGKPCNLLTGEERRIVHEDAGLWSCTVEMLPLAPRARSVTDKKGYDVAVIDEMQMLGDPQRGGSWYAAILGLQAREVHMCGDDTAVDIIKSIVEALGDEVTVHRYERLTPLSVAQQSLGGDYNKVEPGDCVVTFSRTNIYGVKRLIEEQTGRKCAVVYGALPPETRAEQARNFNDPDGHCEILVASDAVGMGLNLKIKRIIFESLVKFNGRSDVPLELTQIKQIAGRAGRYGMTEAKTLPPPTGEKREGRPNPHSSLRVDRLDPSLYGLQEKTAEERGDKLPAKPIFMPRPSSLEVLEAAGATAVPQLDAEQPVSVSTESSSDTSALFDAKENDATFFPLETDVARFPTSPTTSHDVAEHGQLADPNAVVKWHDPPTARAAVEPVAPGGIVTTMHPTDLPLLEQLLPLPLPRLRRAIFNVPHTALAETSSLLPMDITYPQLIDLVSALVALPPHTTAASYEHKLPVAEVVDRYRHVLSLSETETFALCPISHRDPLVLSAFTAMIRSYSETGSTRLEAALVATQLLRTLDVCEGTLAILPPLPPTIGVGRRLLIPPVLITSIPHLESLHKALVAYIWLAFRLPVAFPDLEEAQAAKARAEYVLDQCLLRLPGVRNKKSHERGKQIDAAVAKWRKEHVSPNGTRKMEGQSRRGVEWMAGPVIDRLKSRGQWKGVGLLNAPQATPIEDKLVGAPGT